MENISIVFRVKPPFSNSPQSSGDGALQLVWFNNSCAICSLTDQCKAIRS